MEATQFALEPIKKLTKDLKTAARLLSDTEARYLVDLYYQLQEMRIRSQGQLRAIAQETDDVKGADSTLSHFFAQFQALETQMKGALGAYARSKPIGVWLQSITGIGDVISAGLIANVDIRKAPHVGHLWAFAGLANKEWGKGQKRPHNARLKTLCAFKVGESFVKTQNLDSDFYGHLFAKKKAEYAALNEAGKLVDAATAAMEKRRYGKETEAYKAYSEGRLPKAHIHARARRWTVKMFLSHFHQVYYEMTFKSAAPKPYIIDIGGHADFTAPPNYEPLSAHALTPTIPDPTPARGIE